MSFLDEIKAKIAAVENQIKEHSGAIKNLAEGIEKMVLDKNTASNNLHILNGALQAYNDVLNGVKGGGVGEVVQGVEAGVQAGQEAASEVQEVTSAQS